MRRIAATGVESLLPGSSASCARAWKSSNGPPSLGRNRAPRRGDSPLAAHAKVKC